MIYFLSLLFVLNVFQAECGEHITDIPPKKQSKITKNNGSVGWDVIPEEIWGEIFDFYLLKEIKVVTKNNINDKSIVTDFFNLCSTNKKFFNSLKKYHSPTITLSSEVFS